MDKWSKFTRSVFIERRKPTDVIDKIMQHWTGAGFAAMEEILSDNGCEFSSKETCEDVSLLNLIEVWICNCCRQSFSKWTL